MHSNIWQAVNDDVLDNDIASIASEFGKVPVKSNGIAVSTLIDISLTAWGLVMGPAWNKREYPNPDHFRAMLTRAQSLGPSLVIEIWLAPSRTRPMIWLRTPWVSPRTF